MNRCFYTGIPEQCPQLFAYLYPSLARLSIAPLMEEASAGPEYFVSSRRAAFQSGIRYMMRAKITASKRLLAKEAKHLHQTRRGPYVRELCRVLVQHA